MIFVDIGNTHTRFAIKEGSSWRLIHTVRTAELSAFELEKKMYYAVASVVPEANLLFPPEQTFFVSGCVHLSFGAEKGVPLKTVGADRLCNLAALKRRWGENAVCVDAGSCLTLEILSPNGNFSGGAIMPGRQLCRYAVSQKAAQLFKTPFSETFPLPIGKDTAGALTFGIDRGLVGAVREWLSAAAVKTSRTVVTGGDGTFFADALGLPYDSWLTFEGLAVIESKNSSFCFEK